LTSTFCCADIALQGRSTSKHAGSTVYQPAMFCLGPGDELKTAAEAAQVDGNQIRSFQKNVLHLETVNAIQIQISRIHGKPY
jgi:hypothetical protein